MAVTRLCLRRHRPQSRPHLRPDAGDARRRLPAEIVLRAGGRSRRRLFARPSRTPGASPTSARSSRIPEIRLVVGAGILADRAPMAVRAMRHGKDVMLDKPGATTLEQLAELRRVQAETGRILSILYSEHYTQPATVAAGELVKAGAIGRVLQTIGLGPHRVGNYPRPDWFWKRERTGGILCDIGSHQVEQFLFFTGSREGRDRGEPGRQFRSSGHAGVRGFRRRCCSTSDDATGYIRVDWFTQDGSPVWGDGRLFILGTEGTIELRKYIDIAGRPGGDHLFIVDRKGVRHIDCAGTKIVYGEQLRDDVLEPHRDGDAAEPLLLRDGAGAEGAGARRRGSPASARRSARHERAAQGRRRRRRRRRQPYRGLSRARPTFIRSKRSATSTPSGRRRSPASTASRRSSRISTRC